LNAVAEVRFAPEPVPRELLGALHDIECRLGRDRSREVPQGPRPIDLDLLVWGDRVVEEPELHLPHPGLSGRAFALAPLVELAPELEIPGAGRAADLLAGLADQGIRKVTGSASA
jgi:2-amino-4-hydroxy-6-hydroxymethyldihydropteridine diphosphokinase